MPRHHLKTGLAIGFFGGLLLMGIFAGLPQKVSIKEWEEWSQLTHTVVEQMQARYADLSGVCNGRLTLTTATPVTVSNVTAATTIYFTPYKGSKISLYDGREWKLIQFNEISLSLGTLTSAKNYDVFVFNNAGVLTMELVAWTDNTTRATSITLVSGVYLKATDYSRRYVGTIRTTSTTTTEDSDTKRFVWNYCQRMPRRFYLTEGTNAYSYTTADWRSMNANDAARVELVVGLAQSQLELWNRVLVSSSFDANIYTGICEDCTNTGSIEGGGYGVFSQPSGAYQIGAHLRKTPALGYHYYQWTERGAGSGSQTWYAASTNAYMVGFIDG